MYSQNGALAVCPLLQSAQGHLSRGSDISNLDYVSVVSY